MKKRIGSWILTLAMALALFPAAAVPARAEAAVHNHEGWTEWTETDRLPDTEGSYYLADNVTLSEAWSLPNATIDLCLNGHNITQTGSHHVITVPSGATLNLYDESETAGKITGGNTNHGGGVFVNGGTFTMHGGSITGNTASASGIGVYVDSNGTFNMEGGSITENVKMPFVDENDNDWVVVDGGGAYVNSGTFTMNGGTISRNVAGGAGGGVYVASGGTFTMSGDAAITGNDAYGLSGGGYECGGGVYVDGGNFTMSGGSITDNRSDYGGGVYVMGGTFTLDGEVDISGNKGGELYLNSDDELDFRYVRDDNVCLQASSNVINVASGFGLKHSDKPIGVNTRMNLSDYELSSVVITGGGGKDYESCFRSDQEDDGIDIDINDNELMLEYSGYDVYVGGQMFTKNKTSISGSTGTATFTPPNVEENTPATITLSDYHYEGPGYYYDSARSNFGIFVPEGDVKLMLTGENSITLTGGDGNSFGISIGYGSLEVSGAGSLEVTAADAAHGESYGVYVYDGGMTFSGGTLTAIGGAANMKSYGVYVYDGGMTFSGGTLTAIGGTVAYTGSYSGEPCDSFGVYVYSGSYGGGLTVSGGTVFATGGSVQSTSYREALSYGINCRTLTVTGGDVTATGGSASYAGEVEGSYRIATSSVGIHLNNWSLNDGENPLTISDGTVTARAGTASGGEKNLIYRHGVGVSNYKPNQSVAISGGSLTAAGGSARDQAGSNYYFMGLSGIKLNVTGGVATLTGGTEATDNAPALGTSVTATASTNEDGTNPVDYAAESLSTYQYLRFVHADAAIAPTVTVSSDLTLTYGYTSENTISVTATAAAGATYTLGYQWYQCANANRANPTAVEGATSENFPVPLELNAGAYYYYCVVTAAREDNNKTAATSGVITVTVNKADPNPDTPDGLTAVLGQTLADVTLPSGWAWVDALSTGVGGAGEHSFSAIFTPDDTTNYNTVTTSLTVTVVPPHIHDEITFTAWTDALAESQNGEGATASNSLPANAGSYYLTKNVTLSATWDVPTTGVTNLCLGGKSITQTTRVSVITIIGSGTTLNLYDESGDNGTITHSGGNFRGVEVQSGSTFNMYGGKISGNTTGKVGGGGVYVSSGTFNMHGGTITRNRLNGGNGGAGVHVSNGTFTMTGGEISDNTVSSSIGTVRGGGVYVSNGTFNMHGGTIKNNTATSDIAYGGGVYVFTKSTFTMTGGTITGNKAKSNGGGVYINRNDGKDPNKLAISGNPNISGNTVNGSADNLYVKSSVAIVAPLSDTVNIGVRASFYDSDLTSGWDCMGDADPKNYFTSEYAGRQIYLVGNEARLTFQRTFTFDANGGTGTMSDVETFAGLAFEFPENRFTPPAGKQFLAWETNGTQYKPGAGATFPYNTSTAFTVKALWGYAVTFSSDGGSAVTPLTVTENGKVSPKPADPVRSGYDFGGWYKDSDLTTAWDFDNDTVEGATTLYAKWTANPVTPPAAPSGGSSSPAAASVTVPVSGDSDTVNVTVRVTNGGEATLTSANVSAALDGNDSTGTVAIDLGGLTREVSSVTIPAAIVADVAGAVASAENATDSLTVKLTDGSVTFDAAAVESITAQSDGNDLKLNLDGVQSDAMNDAQQSAVAGLEVAGVLDVYMTSNNVRISDFGGGSAEVRIPFTAPDGRSENEYGVWYVAEDGAMTNQRARYDAEDACFVFTVTHFSNYVIAYGGCLQDETCPIAAYADADPAAWYHDGVHWAIENGVMGGVGDSLFAPDGDTSRAMVAVMLWRLEDEPSADAALTFDDVQPGKWYSDAIRWAAGASVITGWDDAATGRPVFAPDAAVTREQLAAMLWRYAKYKGADVSVGEDTNILSYSDALDVSEYAIPAMQWACGTGIVGGYDDPTGARILAPRSASSRAVVATMLRRYCANLGRQGR